MHSRFGSLALQLVLVAMLGVILAVGVGPRPLAASVPVQSGSEPIVVTEKGCDFDLDNNGDGQPDLPFTPASSDYLPQDTTVIGHCWFQVTTIADAAIQLESGLAGWSAVAEITRETEQYSEEVELNSGESTTVVEAGGYHINLNMSGQTPRGRGEREVAKGYRHELQVPSLFRLIDITVTTDARDKAVVVHETVSSASTAYIRAHDAIANATGNPDSTLPPPVLELGRELLAEGYPRMAERVVSLEFQTAGDEAKDSILPTWAWGVIALVVVLLIFIGVAIWWIRRPPPMPDDDD